MLVMTMMMMIIVMMKIMAMIMAMKIMMMMMQNCTARNQLFSGSNNAKNSKHTSTWNVNRGMTRKTAETANTTWLRRCAGRTSAVRTNMIDQIT